MELHSFPFEHRFEVRSGQFIAIHSGIATSFKGQDLCFRFTWEEGEMDVIFRFIDGGAGMSVKASAEAETNTLVFECKNINVVDWVGNEVPAEIGEFGGRKLYLSYKLRYIYPSPDRLVQYTFFVGPEKPRGPKGE